MGVVFCTWTWAFIFPHSFQLPATIPPCLQQQLRDKRQNHKAALGRIWERTWVTVTTILYCTHAISNWTSWAESNETGCPAYRPWYWLYEIGEVEDNSSVCCMLYALCRLLYDPCFHDRVHTLRTVVTLWFCLVALRWFWEVYCTVTITGNRKRLESYRIRNNLNASKNESGNTRECCMT